MKKLIAFCFCLMAVLTGCGTTDNMDNTSSAPVSEIKTEEISTEIPSETVAEEIIVTTAVETEISETVTTSIYVAVPKETSAPVTSAETVTTIQNLPEDIVTSPIREPDTVKPDRQTVVESYKKIIRTRIEKIMNEGAGTVLLNYALYDMDYDGTPELLVKYGTCEADFRIGIFKYQSDGMITLADDMSGSHTSFGYDYVANQIVLVNGHMNYGHMAWYDIDENGQLRFLIDTGEFEYGTGEDFDESFEAIMKKYNVAWLDSSEFFGNELTWVYHYQDGQLKTEEYGGYDFTYLENYAF